MFTRILNKVILLSMCVFASCNAILDNDICNGDGMTRKVTFKMTMNNSSRYTRAWSDGYETGKDIPYDNRIAYDGLRVLFYTLDNSYIGEASELMYWPLSEDRYHFSGNITELNLVPGTGYKVMVLANCPGNTGMENLYFEIADATYPNGNIPMWGVKQFELNNGELQDLGTIDLLRAMAKVEVVLSDNMTANGYSIQEVSLNHHNTQGNCLPTGWNSVGKTSDLDIVACINSRHSHNSKPLELVEIEDGKKFWIYIPEYNVRHTTTNRPNISITLSNGTEMLQFPNSLKFGTYTAKGELEEDSEEDIVRNHIYRFNIAGIAGGIEFEYNVLPWEDGGTWDRGEFAYPTYHNPVVPDYLNPTAVITSAPVMKYNNTSAAEDDAFTVWFKLTRPTDQLWVPVTDQLSSDYEIRVYNHLGEKLDNPAQWVASDNWYRIVVLPLQPDHTGVTVKFGITYHQDWMPDGNSIYLFINGKADEIAWPESGNDPKIIEIKQI